MSKIKAPGLIALSAMALVALIGTASASASTFTAGELGKPLTATSSNHMFKITGSSTKCLTLQLTGVTEGTLDSGKYHTTTQRVHPEYSGSCEVGGLSGTVTTKGCDYILSADTTSTAGKGDMANLEIVDHPGETCNGITLTADPIFTTCTAVIPKQTIAHALSYQNLSGDKIKITWTAEGIEVDVTQAKGLCPLTAGLHTGASGGSYTGTTEISADGGVTWTA